MIGTILEVIDGGSIWLLLVDTGSGIVHQPVELRHMWDIVSGEGLSSPADLVGRDVELAEDRLTLGFV